MGILSYRTYCLSDFLDGGKYLAQDSDELHPDFVRHGSAMHGHPYFL
jgi:hypothetical protein